MLKIGLIVNPVAGIGGPAALKGSDLPDTLDRANALGVKSQVQERVSILLNKMESKHDQLTWVTCEGAMGSACFPKDTLQRYSIVYRPSYPSAPADTTGAAKRLISEDIDLLIFAGGDGTARLICEMVGTDVPTLGVPSGVKMHSGVFAVTPEAAASVLESILAGRLVASIEGEVRDIDEQKLREGQINTKVFGALSVPDDQLLVQTVKCGGPPEDEIEMEEAAQFVSEMIDSERLTLLGAGQTLYRVKELLNCPNPTLLGIDAYFQGQQLLADAHEGAIWELIQEHESADLWVSMIGGQGFVFGRGNQQFSARILKCLEKRDIHIIALQSKLLALEGRPMRVDTGEPALDQRMAGLYSVTTGYEQQTLYQVT